MSYLSDQDLSPHERWWHEQAERAARLDRAYAQTQRWKERALKAYQMWTWKFGGQRA